MRPFHAFACLALCCLLAASDSPFASAVAPGTRWDRGDQVFFFGDHRGFAGATAWMDQLCGALPGLRDDLQLSGRWISGYRVADLAGWTDVWLADSSVEVAVIVAGATDAQVEKPVDAPAFEQSLLLAIKALVAKNTLVVLATPMPCGDKKTGNPLDQQLDAYAEVVRNVATQTGVQLCDLRAAATSELATLNATDKPDGVFSIQDAGKHWALTAAGHRFAAEHIAQALGELMAKAPLQIVVRGGTFAGETMVPIRLRRADPEAVYEIKYSLNGKDPAGRDGRPYQGPVLIRSHSTLKVYAADKAGSRTATLEREFNEVKLKSVDRPSKREHGLRFELFQGRWGKLPDFDSLGDPLFTGLWYAPDLEMGPDHPDMPAIRENFGLRFTGFIDVPADGVYTFYLGSDDGSRLLLGDQTVVNNDDSHGVIYRHGEIGLREGLHQVMVLYFQGTGGQGLKVQYEGPGIRRSIVPDAAWWHDGREKPKPAMKPR